MRSGEWASRRLDDSGVVRYGGARIPAPFATESYRDSFEDLIWTAAPKDLTCFESTCFKNSPTAPNVSTLLNLKAHIRPVLYMLCSGRWHSWVEFKPGVQFDHA